MRERYKQQGRLLSRILEVTGHNPLGPRRSLEVIARLHGTDWNTLSSRPDTPPLTETKATEQLHLALAEQGIHLTKDELSDLYRQLLGLPDPLQVARIRQHLLHPEQLAADHSISLLLVGPITHSLAALEEAARGTGLDLTRYAWGQPWGRHAVSEQIVIVTDLPYTAKDRCLKVHADALATAFMMFSGEKDSRFQRCIILLPEWPKWRHKTLHREWLRGRLQAFDLTTSLQAAREQEKAFWAGLYT